MWAQLVSQRFSLLLHTQEYDPIEHGHPKVVFFIPLELVPLNDLNSSKPVVQSNFPKLQPAVNRKIPVSSPPSCGQPTQRNVDIWTFPASIKLGEGGKKCKMKLCIHYCSLMKLTVSSNCVKTIWRQKDKLSSLPLV